MFWIFNPPPDWSLIFQCLIVLLVVQDNNHSAVPLVVWDCASQPPLRALIWVVGIQCGQWGEMWKVQGLNRKGDEKAGRAYRQLEGSPRHTMGLGDNAGRCRTSLLSPHK